MNIVRSVINKAGTTDTWQIVLYAVPEGDVVIIRRSEDGSWTMWKKDNGWPGEPRGIYASSDAAEEAGCALLGKPPAAKGE